MKKYKKTIIICGVVLIITGFLFCVFHFNDGSKLNMVNNQDTAIQIGSAIIKEHYPEWYDAVKASLNANESNGVWTVYNSWGSVDGLRAPTIYAKISVKDGTILSVGIE